MKTLMRWSCLLVAIAAILGCFDTANAQTNAFNISPATLTFTSPPGFIPAAQNLTISTTSTLANFTITATGTSCSYVVLSMTAGAASPVAPATVQVAAQIGSAPTGTYSCILTIAAPSMAAVAVPVTMNVTTGASSGNLSVSPTTLTLTAQAGTTPVTSTLTLANSVASTPIDFAASVASTPSGWLQISPTTGTVPPNNTIQVQANPTGLAAGTYNGTITITPAGAAAIAVPVSLTVSGLPALQIQQGLQTVTSVTFYYQNGASLPAPQTLAVSSSSSAVSLPFTLDVTGGSNFLVVTPTGSLNTPQNVTFSISSTVTFSNLAPGTYTANARFTAPNASNVTTNVPVNLVVSNTPLLTQIGSAPSAFNYQVGGSVPASQTLQIGTTSTSLPLTISTALPSGQNWIVPALSANSASAAAPATLTIGVNPTGLTAGTYTGTVTVSSPGIVNTISVPVTLTVGSSTLLGETPSQLAFTYQTGTFPPAAQSINITSSGGTLPFNIAVGTSSCGSTWLSVSQVVGNTGTSGSSVAVSVNPSGISAPNVCTGTLTITSTGAPNTLSVPVVMQVSSTAIIQANPSALSLTGQVGTGITAAQPLTLSSTDSLTALSYTLSSPATWLFISPTSGTTPVNVQISVNTSDASLRIGTNTTTLTLTSPSLQQPITIPVTLTLTSAANLTVAPASLSFSQPAGGTAPAAQNVNIGLTGSGLSGAQFTAVASTNFGTWLTVTPTSGAVPGQIAVSVNGANLSQGTYTGSILVTVPGVGSSPQSIPVTLNITAPQSLAVSASALSFATQIGATQPPASQTFQVTSVGGAVNFTVGTLVSSAACPGFLTASPVSGTTPATVTVGINTANLQAGTCSGTVTVSASGLATQSVNVTLTVTSAPVPAITTIVNGASFVPGSIAPGEIVTLFGSNLGPTTLASYVINANMFATKVADTEVLFDGLAAPIIFVRNDQVAVVVPYEVAGRFQTVIQVRRSNQLSNQLQQRVVDTAPGIFTIPSGGTGQAAVINQNGVVNSIGTPAPKGSVIAIYITGAGQTNPPGVSGALYGSTLSRINAPVTATIGGLPARVEFAGGAPFNIQGLYQVNVTVPQVAGNNPFPVSIDIGGVSTQSNVVIYVQ